MALSHEQGTLIREQRRRIGWTQAELGSYLRPPRTHAAISDIERGRTRLSLDETLMVAESLDVPPETLIPLSLPELEWRKPVTGYEYLVKTINSSQLYEHLNVIGRDGWRLRFMFPDIPHEWRCIFERECRE